MGWCVTKWRVLAVCWDKDCETVLLECGHACCCFECARKVILSRQVGDGERQRGGGMKGREGRGSGRERKGIG